MKGQRASHTASMTSALIKHQKGPILCFLADSKLGCIHKHAQLGILFAYFIFLRMCKHVYDQHLDVIQRQLDHAKAPQPHFFAFFPLPQEQGSFGCETKEGRGWGRVRVVRL